MLGESSDVPVAIPEETVGIQPQLISAEAYVVILLSLL